MVATCDHLRRRPARSAAQAPIWSCRPGRSPAATSLSSARSFLLGISRPGLEQALDPALIHLRHTVGESHRQPLAAQHILAAGDDDIAGERYDVLTHVEDGGIAGRVLVLLHDGNAALGLDPLD